MLYNIQKHLLINHPLLWNIRIVPVLVCTVLLNLLFFGIGYAFTYIDFGSMYSYSSSSEGFIYFAAVITGILSFIFWMIYYAKNNAFKIFYPKSTAGMYSEWLLIFVIVFSMASYPFSLNNGKQQKIKSYVPEAEMLEAAKILNMVNILIPASKTDYYQEYPSDYKKDLEKENFIREPIRMSESDSISAVEEPRVYKGIDQLVKEAEEAKKIYEDYPDFAQLSLLNYNGYSHFYLSSEYDIDAPGIRDVKKWLVDEDKEKIEKLMDSFLALHKKHNLETNLTRDKWMELVYNPRKYPVGDFNLICSWNVHNPLSYYGRYDNYGNEIDLSNAYYLQYRELASAYSTIMNAYLNKESDRYTIFFTVCFALCIALMVFSFRVTSGKSWLIAFVSGGLILLIFLFFTLIFASFDYYSGYPYLFIKLVLCLFVGEFIYILFKIINNKKSKGRSDVVINHLIWLIPAVPALILLFIYGVSHDTCDSVESMCLYDLMDEHSWEILWGNVALAFVSVWCFTRFFLLKWKSLPEG